MAMRFQILGSSSSGNSALLVTENCKVLIDAGFSARRLGRMLEACGESIDTIDAVFISHEHSDHTSGLNGLSRQPGLKVFANRSTAQAIQEKLNRRVNWQLFETGNNFSFRDLDVKTFSVPHDAYDPVGYTFSQGGTDQTQPGPSLAWVIDLGYVPQLVREMVRHVEVLVLEANYDLKMLDDDPGRPWPLKQRIKSRHGHLSNQDAFEFLTSEEHPGWRHVYLAHLSKDCNKVSLVEDLFNGPESSRRPFDLTVVDPINCSPLRYDFQNSAKEDVKSQ